MLNPFFTEKSLILNATQKAVNEKRSMQKMYEKI